MFRACERGLISGLVLVAFVLRLHQIDLQSWWWDEGYSTYLARSGVLATLQLTSVDIHPPLYYMLLSMWGTLAGYTEFASRLLSAFLNLVTIPFIYQVGKRSINGRAGFFAALVLTFSPAHVYYSQEVRMYTLFALEYLAALWLLWRLAVSTRWRWQLLAGLAFVEAMMMYTHYFSVVGIAFINLVALVAVLKRSPVERWQRIREWIGSQVGAAVLYLPWLPFALRQSLAYEDDRAKPLPFDDFVGLMWHFFNVGIRGAIGNPRREPPHPDFILASSLFGVLLVLSLVAVIVARMRQQRAREKTALAFWVAAFAVPLLLVFGLMFWKPTVHPRYV
ncbi:MAG: glycosyltransferase family 39 protein, partial [Anaerolineae bacterium]|nr:glycosyltransferase family 39 protein [Anaerolineae bacterium]